MQLEIDDGPMKARSLAVSMALIAGCAWVAGCNSLPDGCSYQKILTSTGVRVPAKNHIRVSFDDGHTYVYIGDFVGFSAENNFEPNTRLMVCKPSAKFPSYTISEPVWSGLYLPFKRVR